MPDTRALTKTEILDQLDRLNRQPFKDWLTDIIGALPDSDAMRKYFKKYPDRAAQTLTQAAKLAGFSDRAQINNTNIYAIVATASDAELMARLTKALETLGAAERQPKTIDHQPDDQPD